jgi:MoaD family protein
MVTVRLYGYFRDCARQREFQLDAVNVKAALQQMLDKWNCFDTHLLEEGSSRDAIKVKAYVKIIVNGRGIEALDGLDTVVGEDDALVIFPPVGGG